MIVVVKNKDVVRPAIDACERCYSFWSLYISSLLSWRSYASKWVNDPIYRAKIIEAVKVCDKSVVPNYRQKSVETVDASQMCGVRSWIILNETEMKNQSGKKYLAKTEYSGVQITVPKENGAGEEAVWAFPNPSAPFRTIEARWIQGEEERCLVQPAEADIWEGKAAEVKNAVQLARLADSNFGKLVDRSQPMVTFDKWRQRIGGTGDGVGAIGDGDRIPTGRLQITPRKANAPMPAGSSQDNLSVVPTQAGRTSLPSTVDQAALRAKNADIELDNPFLPPDEFDVEAADSASQIDASSEVCTAGYLLGRDWRGIEVNWDWIALH